MLPLITNAPVSTPAVQNQSVLPSASLLLSATADSSAVSRQQLPNAVLATGAATAYFPGTTSQRLQGTGSERVQRIAVPPPTGDYVEVALPPPPVVAARASVPVTLGIPLTTQLTAQLMAHQWRAASVSGSSPEIASIQREEKNASARMREPSFGSARGADAYGIATARLAKLPLPTPAELPAEPASEPQVAP
jgi:hypothetical protein